ncbi:T3SS (YopN, CesT) and YbjN peptide-binding chaperone 1 [Aestuariimicrobium ganziense]|uniref:T3SS (YopN, CesT) and YbjN peptide-binding chaperone 1 n=1 Tax=Aestuariimicrobium ganziense TaxID=2773677 RepID=UPI001945A8FD|nr:YbjN domain-containing protein [Aestuariimicrobium ganziense]
MPQSTDFDLDRSITEAWQQFQDRLAEVVSMVDDGSLTIGTLSTSDDQAPFVRFSHARGRDDIVLEATSNASLGEHFQLSLDQLNALEALGYQPPSVDEGAGSALFQLARPQADYVELARVAVATLRDVFGVQHPVFLAPDQLAEVLTDESPTSHESLSRYDADDLVAIVPDDQGHLDALVSAELTQMFGHPPIRDSEGDVALRVGSTMVFIRSMPKADELLLFSALVHEVEGRSRAVEVLNDLNVESRFGRFALHRDRVFVTLSVLAHPFVPAHLHQALRVISEIADGIDDELALKLKGRTTFTD